MSLQHFISLYVFFWSFCLNCPGLSGRLVFQTSHTANILCQPSTMICDSDTFNALHRNISSILAYFEFWLLILYQWLNEIRTSLYNDNNNDSIRQLLDGILRSNQLNIFKMRMPNASGTVPGEMLSDAFNNPGSYLPHSIVLDVKHEMLFDTVNKRWAC